MKLTPGSSETKSSKVAPPTPSITYKLSNEVFKTMGWTSQPENAVVVPVVTMKAKFSRSVISPWFVAGRSMTRTYGNGKTLCVANEDGTGRIYYPNGKLAVSIRKSSVGTVTRIIVKTPGGVGLDGVRRRPQLCAVFDSLGNGVVYDCDKRKRLVYDQNHGMAWLTPDGMPIYWKWHNLQYSGSLTTFDDFDGDVTTNRDRRSRAKGKDMSVVAAMKKMESAGVFPRPSASRTSGTAPLSAWNPSEAPFGDSRYVNTSWIRPASPIRPIIFQINAYVGLRILNQSDIALTFFADCQQTRLNIGILYNPYDKLAVDKVYSNVMREKVWCPFEVLPVKTKSMEIIRRLIKNEKYPPCWNRS